MVVSKNLEYVASTYKNNEISITKFGEEKLVAILKDNSTSDIVSLRFAKKDSHLHLIAVMEDSAINIWDIEKQKKIQSLKETDEHIYYLSVSQDGSTVAASL